MVSTFFGLFFKFQVKNIFVFLKIQLYFSKYNSNYIKPLLNLIKRIYKYCSIMKEQVPTINNNNNSYIILNNLY